MSRAAEEIYHLKPILLDSQGQKSKHHVSWLCLVSLGSPSEYETSSCRWSRGQSWQLYSQFADRLNIKASVCSCTCCSDQSFTCIWSVLVSAAAGTAGRKLCWAVISERSWRNGYRIFLNLFFTSMKLLFHSLAWILRTAWPEKLWRGHWNRMQRADPKRQSWRKRQTAKILWGQTESAIKLVINKSGGACIFFFCASCVW